MNLSDNHIGDSGISELARIFTDNAPRLIKLTLANVNATSTSIGKLLYSLKSNNFLTHLNLENNDLSGQGFD